MTDEQRAADNNRRNAQRRRRHVITTAVGEIDDEQSVPVADVGSRDHHCEHCGAKLW